MNSPFKIEFVGPSSEESKSNVPGCYELESSRGVVVSISWGKLVNELDIPLESQEIHLQEDVPTLVRINWIGGGHEAPPFKIGADREATITYTLKERAERVESAEKLKFNGASAKIHRAEMPEGRYRFYSPSNQSFIIVSSGDADEIFVHERELMSDPLGEYSSEIRCDFWRPQKNIEIRLDNYSTAEPKTCEILIKRFPLE